MSELRLKPLVRLYLHASGIIGAIILVNISKDAMDWRSFFATLIVMWQDNVTPIARTPFSWLDTVSAGLWPEWGYDYILFCVLVGAGQIWVTNWMAGGSKPSQPGRTTSVGIAARLRGVLLSFATFVFAGLAWPVWMLWFAAAVIIERDRPEVRYYLGSLVFVGMGPFLYLIGFWILNATLPLIGM